MERDEHLFHSVWFGDWWDEDIPFRTSLGASIPAGIQSFPRTGPPYENWTRGKFPYRLENHAAGVGHPTLAFFLGQLFPTSRVRTRLPRALSRAFRRRFVSLLSDLS